MTIHPWRTASLVALLCTGATGSDADPRPLRLTQTRITIPQVDYEPALHTGADGLPRLDLKAVPWERVVEGAHAAVILESRYVRVTLLPEMGRVYSMVYLPTGHETLWRNDIVRPGGANNATGWWLWIGGIEYTLPGEEHGYTWALPWTWEILEDGVHRKAVRVQVVEPTTGLRETIDFSVESGSAAMEAAIHIRNPTEHTVDYAHWVNPMWAPGGRNEVTDNTELIIPTKHIVIPERWQANLGPSPQTWADSPLRWLRNWENMGDLMAVGLDAGFYGAYSHDEDEGVVRVFDADITPGVDVWTYGFHPEKIPMGSGGPNKGYVEMWGGTVATFPDERGALAPGQSVDWTEWIYPFQRTGGLTYADRWLAARCRFIRQTGELDVRICPVRELVHASVEVLRGERVIATHPVSASPSAPWSHAFTLSAGIPLAELLIVVRAGEQVLSRFRPQAAR
ncbi:MAG TPA: DUF5107 domain-containing protein [Candidatus Handelsmanbacteria bacterium]|nr:DUF5107 domain-containing protein [Candidatus Handelsmanbacteria bacterium]